MSVTTKRINLDFYNNNLVTVYAKQLDTDSRIINVTCTDHGKKVTLDAGSMSAFVRYKKSDGNECFNDGQILEDGTIDIVLTQQMLASPGKQDVDVIIAASTGITADDLASARLYEMGVTLISTMTFHVQVQGSVMKHSNVVSTTEYEALTAALVRLTATEKHIKEVTDNCEEVTGNYADTREACMEAANDANNAASQATSATSDANNAATQARNATAEATSAATKANNAATAATSAANNANEAAERCQSIVGDVETNGAVLNSQVGKANGVASLDANGHIPNSQMPFGLVNNLTTTTTGNALDAKQGNVLKAECDNLRTYINNSITDIDKDIEDLKTFYNGKLEELEEFFNEKLAALPVTHVGEVGSVPDNSVGKEGDYYVIPIE